METIKEKRENPDSELKRIANSSIEELENEVKKDHEKVNAKSMSLRNFKIYRGDDERGELVNYQCEVTEGMVVLDVIHRIQADQANDLACRWNCKAGKCGSCSIEINGKPRLGCMTRMNEFEEDQTLTITPLKSFPVIKDIVTDVSWNYKQNQEITPFTPSEESKKKDFVMMQKDVDRVQEFRKCISVIYVKTCVT